MTCALVTLGIVFLTTVATIALCLKIFGPVK